MKKNKNINRAESLSHVPAADLEEVSGGDKLPNVPEAELEKDEGGFKVPGQGVRSDSVCVGEAITWCKDYDQLSQIDELIARR